jgi:hypothetical protein
MVAYSFNARFIMPILARTKRQTIRAPRKGRSRHAEPGQDLQLYTAMRTKYCTLIGRAMCIGVVPVQLDFEINNLTVDGELDGRRDLFARSDGFQDWAEMRLFWAKEHPGINVFDGALIRWIGFQPSAAQLWAETEKQ